MRRSITSSLLCFREQLTDDSISAAPRADLSVALSRRDGQRIGLATALAALTPTPGRVLVLTIASGFYEPKGGRTVGPGIAPA